MDLANKTALVTGGTDGIGAQQIRQLRDKGVTVVTQGRDAGRVEATRAAVFEVIAADLSNSHGFETLIHAASGRPIDIFCWASWAGYAQRLRPMRKRCSAGARGRRRNRSSIARGA